MKIGLRILLGYFVIVAIAGILLMRVFVQEVKPGVRQAMEDTLADTANVLAELATDDMLAGRMADGQFARRVGALRDRDVGAEIWDFRKHRVSYRIMVTDASGIVVYDSAGIDLGRDNSRWNDVYRTLRGEYGARSTRSDPDDDSTSVMHVAAPIRRNGEIIGVLTVAKPNSAMAPFIARSERIVRRWGLLLLGVALSIGLVAAWWLSRQLGGLQRYARAVTAGERATLPDSAGEFADLGRALETMRGRLEGKQYVERYVHSLTHELKAPLTAIRGAAELLTDPALPDAERMRFAAHVDQQSERMAQAIDKLLALAAVESRQRIDQPEEMDASALVADVAEAFVLQARKAGVAIHGDGRDGPHRIIGDAFLLRQAVSNLFDNALAHAPQGSAVDWCVRGEGGQVLVEILDRGAGIPDYALGRVFERFYSLPRPDGGRSSGLGLPFVAEVAELHGGSVSLCNREGGGAIGQLRLPGARGPVR